MEKSMDLNESVSFLTDSKEFSFHGNLYIYIDICSRVTAATRDTWHAITVWKVTNSSNDRDRYLWHLLWTQENSVISFQKWVKIYQNIFSVFSEIFIYKTVDKKV